MNDKILNPNCSEYVQRIKLTPEELEFARRIARKFYKTGDKYNDDEYNELCEELKNGTDEKSTFGSFISEGLAKPYEFIKETIKEERAALDITKERWWKRDIDDSKIAEVDMS